MNDPEPDRPTSPTVISIRLRAPDHTPFGAWAIAYQDDMECRVRTGLVPAQPTSSLTRAEAAVAALSCILQLAPERGLIDLDVMGGLEIRRAFFDALRPFPAIRLATQSSLPLRQATQKALTTLLPGAKVTPLPAMPQSTPTARDLVVAVDASIASNRSVAGLGWVVAHPDGEILSCGQAVKKVRRRGDILLGELTAIHRGLNDARTHGFPATGKGAVTVLSDSQPALAALSQSSSRRRVMSEDCQRVVEKILAMAAGHPVTFDWVKGHRGHRLNEAADRLAVMARRNAEFNVPLATAERMFADFEAELAAPAAA